MAKRSYLNLNQQPNGDFEVHFEGCLFLPQPSNREYLGDFDYCWQAVAEAKRRHPRLNRINGCYYCMRDCHVS